jgi:hypothetical protein
LRLPFQEVLVARHDDVDVVSSGECDEVVVVRVARFGLDVSGSSTRSAIVSIVSTNNVASSRLIHFAQTRTSREDLADLAEEFRTLTTSKPALPLSHDSMMR